MDQTNKVKLNNKIGELNQTIAFYFWTMIDSFLINFIPSTIGCNKPNQPILYGPLLLWKPAITNRSIKAKSPTVPSINNINEVGADGNGEERQVIGVFYATLICYLQK